MSEVSDRLQKMKEGLVAQQARLEELEAATVRLPQAEDELKQAQGAEDRALSAYHKAVKTRKDLEAEISLCKQRLGIRVRPVGKAKTARKTASEIIEAPE